VGEGAGVVNSVHRYLNELRTVNRDPTLDTPIVSSDAA